MFRAAIQAFDAANAADPSKIAGEAAEVVYARRMTDWLDRLYPDAGEILHLAARSQHLRRWEIPRSNFPMTRGGYHQWRTSLYAFHADIAGKILADIGYDAKSIERIRSLLKKQNLKSDPQMQMLEDVACLVFLESYFAEFAAKHEEEKVLGILRRTWKKMSPLAHIAAMELQLSPAARGLLEKALKVI